ncbi:MAG: alpha/beta hydrolase [Chthoniobacterales bacterium]|nr:alpha/beta hydrolase [Chthoniobacterales bacterium]
MKPFNHLAGKHLEGDGAKIYYEPTGAEDGPVLLFLHGGFGSIEDFNPVLAGLQKDFRVIGIDSRGQGKSTLGEDALTYGRVQKDVERVLDHLGIDTLSVIGFSDGGIAAYRLASLTSLKVEKLVTIGSRWHLKNTESVRELLAKVTGESWPRLASRRSVVLPEQ